MSRRLNPEVKVIGINAGLGVALYPFRANLLFNTECRGVFHTKKNEQWEANFPNTPLYRGELPVKYMKNPIDALISSPDCGSGSVLRYSRAKKLGNHKENESLIMFFKAVELYLPKFFLFENLDGLFKSFPEEQFDGALKHYRLIKHNKSVSYWGNSQKTRKRLVVVGIRNDVPAKVDKYFKLPDLREKISTCKELYGDLPGLSYPEIGHIRESMKIPISIHAGKKLTPSKIQQVWQTKLKGKKRWDTFGEFKFNSAPGVYRNLDGDYPATARKANRQFDSQGLMLTPRQLARIMGIPDKFKIHIDMSRKGYWINKGRLCMTKGMVYEVPKWFKKCLIKSQHIWN